MIVVGDARQGGERLPLRARAEDELALRGQLVEVDGPHEDVVGSLDVPEVAGDVEVLAHRAADHAHRPPDLDGDVDRLLHPVDVRGERRDQHPAVLGGDDLAERLPDDPLRVA